MADKRPFSWGVPVASVLTFTLVIAMVWGLGATAVQGSTLTVTKTSDTNDGICDADCSLREAIAAAVSGDTINIPAGAYTLTFGSALVIDKNLTLTGAGAGSTIIQAATEPAVLNSRVFRISGGNVTISGVTIQNGRDNIGSGILNTGSSLTLTNSTVRSNSATVSGGGIYNGVVLTLTNSTVSGNSAGNTGGGIYNTGTLTLTNSIVSGNSANPGQGGGIFNNDSLILTNSTISNNTATFDGGGIYNHNGTVDMTNSTVTGNVADDSGGGIVIILADGDTVKLVNTIIAGNTAPNPSNGPDCFGSLTSQGNNLIGTSVGCSFTPITGDLVNVDAKLGPLQDNGGPTFTHALLGGSPAIDAGDNASCPATDQRGVPRPQGAACDIGAYEVETAPPVVPPLDHFWCYLTQAPRVTLEDQFDRAAGVTETATLPQTAVRLCNPAEKIHAGQLTPIQNPDHHLKLYPMRAQPLAPTREVTVSNQFGENQVLTLSQPDMLAVPTQKEGQPEPVGLDHFKCYRVTNVLNVKKAVTLRDEFFQTPQSVTVSTAFRFCNPVKKVHDNVVTPILNPDAHLVCDRITPKAFTRTVNVHNQFGDETLNLAKADLLCVPSRMTGPSPIQPPEGLIGWWPGDGNANGIVDGNNGTLVGGATFGPGFVRQAFDLDGSSGYIRVADHPSLDTPDGFTVDAWIYPRAFGGARVIASKWDDPTGQWSWIFKLHNDGSGRLRIEISRGDHNALGDLEGVTILPLNTWSHVAASYDRLTSRLRLYVNGNLDSEGFAQFPGVGVNNSATDLLIGATNGQITSPSEHFHGLIDELDLFNRALSDTEIKAIFDAGSAGKIEP